MQVNLDQYTQRKTTRMLFLCTLTFVHHGEGQRIQFVSGQNAPGFWGLTFQCSIMSVYYFYNPNYSEILTWATYPITTFPLLWSISGTPDPGPSWYGWGHVDSWPTRLGKFSSHSQAVYFHLACMHSTCRGVMAAISPSNTNTRS